MKAKNEKAR